MREKAEVHGDLFTESFVEEGKELVAHAATKECGVFVSGVVEGGELLLLEVGGEIALGEGEDRAPDCDVIACGDLLHGG